MEESNVDRDMFARAPDLSTGGGMKEGRVVFRGVYSSQKLSFL